MGSQRAAHRGLSKVTAKRRPVLLCTTGGALRHNETGRPGTQRSAVQRVKGERTAHGMRALHTRSGRRAAEPGAKPRGRTTAGATRATIGERKRRARRSGGAADEPPYAPGLARLRVRLTFRRRREPTVAQTHGGVAVRLNFAFAERRSEKQEVPQTPASQTCPDANPEKQKCIRSFLSQNAGGYRP